MNNQFIIIGLAFLFFGCNHTNQSKKKVNEFTPEVPEYFGEFPVDEENLITKNGANLGRYLFYDTRLSSGNRVSCASCHHQERAFADETRISHIGSPSGEPQRNTPSIQNIAYHQGLFWDGGSTSLELQAQAPVTHKQEMAGNWKEIISKLNQDTLYPELFKKAYNSKKITVRKIAYALAQFEKILVSHNAKYDQVKRGEATFSTIETKGYQLFKNKCASCHQEGLFTDNKYHNNGIDSDFYFASVEDPRWGRYRISLDSNDIGRYKTPTLRNLLFTAPYMHDGRFTLLEEVLHHYSEQVKESKYTEKVLSKMHLKEEEQIQLKAFLHTLTDSTFIQDKKYSNPFEK